MKSKINLIAVISVLIFIFSCSPSATYKPLSKQVLANKKIAFLYDIDYQVSVKGFFGGLAARAVVKGMMYKFIKKHQDGLFKYAISTAGKAMTDAGVSEINIDKNNSFTFTVDSEFNTHKKLSFIASKGYDLVLFLSTYLQYRHVTGSGVDECYYRHSLKLVNAVNGNIEYFVFETPIIEFEFEAVDGHNYTRKEILEKDEKSQMYKLLLACLKYFNAKSAGYIKTGETPVFREEANAEKFIKAVSI
jgi:hypothetical protein